MMSAPAFHRETVEPATVAAGICRERTSLRVLRTIAVVSSLIPLLLLGSLVASPGIAQATAHPQILTLEGCGKPLPVTIGNPDDFKQFNVDLDAYKKNEATKMVRTLTGICQSSAKDRQIIDGKVGSVRLINAQGAEDPNPYIGGRVLLIEFVGGKFGEAAFRAAVMRALARGSIVHPGFDCAKATRPAENLICAEPDLARADQDMTDLYHQALKAATGDAERRKRVIQSQRDWLAHRDDHCIFGKPPSDQKGWDTIIACLLTQYQERMGALDNLQSGQPSQTPPGKAYFNAISQSELIFDLHEDGKAQFSISNGTERGICNLGSDENSLVTQTKANTYLWTDTLSNCKVKFVFAGDRIQVSYQGDCFSTYCGVHAPDFQGEYEKKK